MKKISILFILIIGLTLFGCAGMSDTGQHSLSGAAIGTGAAAIVGAIAGHTARGGARLFAMEIWYISTQSKENNMAYRYGQDRLFPYFSIRPAAQTQYRLKKVRPC